MDGRTVCAGSAVSRQIRALDLERLPLIADSSGAGLVMSLLQRLKATGGPMPGRVVLLSPWVDLECLFLDGQTEADPQTLIVRDQVDMCAPTYLDGHPANDPAVNPRWTEARTTVAGNPVAGAIVERAEALLDNDRERLLATAAAFDAAGCRYQSARTTALAAAVRPAAPPSPTSASP